MSEIIRVLGDTHGRKNWRNIVENNDFDKVVFLGDYVDTHEYISPLEQRENLRDIIEYKKKNMNRVILLFGNHDYHYIADEHYSGYQPTYRFEFENIFREAIRNDLIQMCFIHNNFLMIHAGVTKTWCKSVFGSEKVAFLEKDINDMFKFKPSVFRFTSGDYNNVYGDEVGQSPIWVRPRSLFADKIDGYTQIVGHTTQDKISIGSKKHYSPREERMIDTGGVILIDTLGTSGEYLEICDNELVIRK